MSKSQQSWNKKEREKKKQKDKQDKADKKQERKANASNKSFEEMLAYVDENGNLVDAPPDPSRKKEVDLEDIVIGVPKQNNAAQAAGRTGVITFFNESKGYGFIRDLQTQESIFVHVNELLDPVKENSRVQFETARSPKGLNAIRVKLA
ncbi:MAG: cold shock domain-containing protein [Chitinophagaceae bacterium]|jgi:cold shock CspA family protein|nr:cold shock domain-containing protein [Chitinophagaceae bacterium]